MFKQAQRTADPLKSGTRAAAQVERFGIQESEQRLSQLPQVGIRRLLGDLLYPCDQLYLFGGL